MTSLRDMGHVVRWCADECTRQRSGEQSVAWMFAGWQYAHGHRNRPPLLRDILALGAIVEPRHNLGGLRRVGVRVGDDIKMAPGLVPAALDRLLDAWTLLPADAWFLQYEECHPFRDGNGRTGTILWNWHRGTLARPDDAPDFWTTDVARVRAARLNQSVWRLGVLR